jgi:RNA polymerase sigma factor (sigma-70 family)
MVKIMSSMEGYHTTPDIHPYPYPAVGAHNRIVSSTYASEQEESAWSEISPYAAIDPVHNIEHDLPAEDTPAPYDTQPSSIDIDDRDVSLSGLAQYMRELRQQSRVSSDVEARIVEQARSGDQASKHQLIESRLPYIMHVAMRYHVYAEHEDVMDIAGVANLAVTAQIDKALTMRNPVAYLCGIAKREIRSYCFYHSRLIPIKDHHMSVAEAPTVISLDAQRKDVQDRYLSAPALVNAPEPASTYTEQFHQALDQLPEGERQVVARHHGLHDGTYEEFTDIAQSLTVTRPTVYRRYYRALGKLRELVALSLPAHIYKS